MVILEKENWSKTFSNEDFSDCDIAAIEFDGCTFTDCDFSEASLAKSTFSDCAFERCNLSVVRLDYCKLSDVTFRDCKLLGVDWTRVAWPRMLFESPIRFYDCLLSDSSFHGLQLPEIVMEGCTTHNVDFREGDFSKASFIRSDFTGAIFSETNLTGTDFYGAIEFDIDIARNQIAQAKFDRFEAVRLLACLDIELID